jgi:NADH-quinone oxidoreductase subunit L
MGGLRKFLPVTFATMGIATLAIAGVPPFAGFFSKDEIIGAAWLGAEGHSAFSQAKLFGIPGSTWMGFIGGTLTITAFLTAFYMGRMMVYTFFGDNRTGETERRHLHEGGWTLTVPLIVLALLSTLGGLLNVEPEVPIVNWFDFGQGAALHHWLHPVVEGSDRVVEGAVASGALSAVPPVEHHSRIPIVVAIVIGIGGLALAWAMLARRRLRTATEEPAYRNGAERVLYNKYYIDELYDSLVVRPLGALSRMYAAFDRYVIDALVDFFGRLSQGLGLLAGRTQTGLLNTYAFVIIVGVLVVLGSFVAL